MSQKVAQHQRAASKADVTKPLFEPGQVVHVRPAQAEPEYVAPPVVNLQDVVPVPGRRPLERLEADRAASASTVVDLLAQIPQDTHRGPAGPTDAQTEASRQASVDFIARALARQPRPESRESIEAREARAHAENQELLRAEIATSVHNESYSG